MKSTSPSAVSRAANALSRHLGRLGWRAVTLSVTLVASTLTGCAITPMEGGYPDGPPVVYVQTPPPAPLHEVVGPPPGPGFVWVSGHWFWSGAQYVWASGHWLAMRPEYIWVQPVWQRSSRGWWLQGGGWQRQAAPAYPRGYAEPYRSPQHMPPQPRYWSDDDRQPRAPREDGRRFMPTPAPAQPPVTAPPSQTPRQVAPEPQQNRPIQRSERPAPPPPERGQDAQDGNDRGKPLLGWPTWKRNRGQEAQ